MPEKDSPNRRRLTIAAIERFTLPPGKREALLWDSEVRHLGVRFREGKQPAFIFMCKFGGRTLRLTIGPTDAITIDQARKEAMRLNAMVAQGKDPREERQRSIEAARNARAERRRARATFGELWEAYTEVNGHKWSVAHRADHEAAIQPPGQERRRSSAKTVAGVLWPLVSVPLCELTPELAGELFHREAGRRPAVAARAFRLFRACLRWAEGRSAWKGIIETEAVIRASGEHVAKRSKPKEDCLQREQLRPWFEAVQTIGTPAIRAYLQVLLLTGRRPSEIRLLRWADVDFTWNTLRVSDKDEGAQIIPLTPYVRKLLQGLPRRNQWVFSVKEGPIAPPARQHAKALDLAGLPHVSLHGLRRTFSSLSEWVEMPVGISAQIQGHKPSATAERHYKRRPIDLLRLWHTRLEAWILEQAGIEQPEPEAKPLEVVR